MCSDPCLVLCYGCMQVKPIVLWLTANSLLEKLGGGKYPDHFYVVRDAVVAMDSTLINNPVRDLCLQGSLKKGGQDDEDCGDERPSSKKARV